MTFMKEGESAKIIQDLRRENASLSKELSEIKLLHEQLLHENPQENASEKRVNILKSQIFQLERQVNLLSKVVNGYAGAHLELQLMLEALIKQLGHEKGSAKDESIKLARQMLGKLSKSNRGASEDNSFPLMFMADFIQPPSSSDASQRDVFDTRLPVTVLDICSSEKTNHISLKQMGCLESKLAQLYGKLIQIRSSFDVGPNSVPCLLQRIREHSQSYVTPCCDLIGECCHDLLCLSLLLPGNPQNYAKRKPPPLPPPELSSSEVIARLPPLIRNKKEVRDAIEKMCNCFLQLDDMKRTKCKALEGELHFHKSAYVLVVDYMRTLFDSMRRGYESFETSVQELVCKPLKAILSRYDVLSATADDEALRELLKQLKQDAPQLMCVVDSLSSPSSKTEHTGSAALSEFGKNFFDSLLELEKGCSKTLSV